MRGLGLVKKAPKNVTGNKKVETTSSNLEASKGKGAAKATDNKNKAKSKNVGKDAPKREAIEKVSQEEALAEPTEFLTQQMSFLSGGWRMRVAIAIALINARKADVLLLDEATNHCEISHPSLYFLPLTIVL